MEANSKEPLIISKSMVIEIIFPFIFRFSISKELRFIQGFQSLNADINKHGAPYTLKLANRLFGEKAYNFLPCALLFVFSKLQRQCRFFTQHNRVTQTSFNFYEHSEK